MIRLTRRYRFSASHRLHTSALSESENQALYGKCNNPYGHGHNYILEVSVAGPIDEQSGLVARLETLDTLVQSRLIGTLDHRNLNYDVPVFQSKVPTTENLLEEARRVLSAEWASAFPNGRPLLAGMRLLETNRNSVELTTLS